MKNIELAQKLISVAFDGKKDKAGKPYVEHLRRVAEGFTQETTFICALLHDILEDCSHWSKQAISDIFGTTVADTVDVLTKRGNESYENYIERIGSDWRAIDIKIKDLEDNMNLTRLSEITEPDLHRLKKHHKAWLKLKSL